MFSYNVGFKVWADEVQPSSNNKDHEVVREQIRDGIRPGRAKQNKVVERFYRCPSCDNDWEPPIGGTKAGYIYFDGHFFFRPETKICPKCKTNKDI